MYSTTSASYEPDLSAVELDRALESLCQSVRRTEWLMCRYLADMADAGRFRDVGWYSDVVHYARKRFGLGVKSTRERVRIGRALRALPAIEKAFVEDRLSYSRVREVTRVAGPGTEADWLRLARRLPMRELERRVAGAVGAKEVCDEPARVNWRTPEIVELSMRIPAEIWALLQRAMQGARQAAEAPISDAEAIEAVAREALAVLTEGVDATDLGDPRKAVVLYQCKECGVTELETNAGALPLPPHAAERLSAGAKRIDLDTEGRCEACVGGVMPAAVRRAVLARDRGKCRICGRRRYVDVHHFHPQSEGGEHSRENCGCLCGGCHQAVHEGALRIEGSAEAALTWYDRYGVEQGTEVPGREGLSGLSEDAVEVLRAMGGRGGFTIDGLCAQMGVHVSKVMRGLGELEMTGKVRRGLAGEYSPIQAPGCERGPIESPPTTAEPKAARTESPPRAECCHATSDEQLLPDLELEPSESRDQVLRTMQAEPDQRWSADSLCSATGLHVSLVTQALIQLQLTRKICETTYFDYVLAGSAAAAMHARRRALGRAPQRGTRRRRPRRRVERVRL
jgi:hypothetical protein